MLSRIITLIWRIYKKEEPPNSEEDKTRGEGDGEEELEEVVERHRLPGQDNGHWDCSVQHDRDT